LLRTTSPIPVIFNTLDPNGEIQHVQGFPQRHGNLADAVNS
jgi:hypothetical protein